MNLRNPAFLLATWGGLGLSPKAPGTVGTLGALPFAALIHWAWAGTLWGGPLALAIAAIAAYGAGIWACNKVIGARADKDPGFVVVDEVVGVWITLLPAALDWRLYVAGFLLFRVLDIAKPWPISWADQSLPGAHGVMLDDVLAGLIALPIMVGLKMWIGA